MKNYKRLTERRSGAVIDNCGNCPNVNNKQGCNYKKCYDIMKNRLCDIEDKIESGELCDREEVRKETAREILQTLYRQTHNYYPSIDSYCVSRKVILVKDLEDACKKYGVNLEDQ